MIITLNLLYENFDITIANLVKTANKIINQI